MDGCRPAPDLARGRTDRALQSQEHGHPRRAPRSPHAVPVEWHAVRSDAGPSRRRSAGPDDCAGRRQGIASRSRRCSTRCRTPASSAATSRTPPRQTERSRSRCRCLGMCEARDSRSKSQRMSGSAWGRRSSVLRRGDRRTSRGRDPSRGAVARLTQGQSGLM